jgi:hypothetical protein
MQVPVHEQDLLETLSPLRTRPDAGPGDVPDATLDALVIALSSPNPELRDDLAAATLVRWIALDHLLSDEAMRELHGQAISAAGPLATLGDQDSDTIFGRSFTILLLALLHAADNAAGYLSDDQWQGTVAALARVGQSELDLRAQVPGKGWAHVIAHAADLADELAQSGRCTTAGAREVLHALSSLVNRLEQSFLGEEEDRIAVAVASLIGGAYISVADLRDIAGIDPGDPMELPPARRANWKAVARSLFFRLPDGLARSEADRMQRDLTSV